MWRQNAGFQLLVNYSRYQALSMDLCRCKWNYTILYFLSGIVGI